MIARLIPASSLTPGPATIVFSLPGRTIRSRVLMAQAEPHGVVRVAFASGDVIAFSARTMVGQLAPTPGPRLRRAR